MKLVNQSRLLNYNLLQTNLSYCEENKKIALEVNPAHILKETKLVRFFTLNWGNRYCFFRLIVVEHPLSMENFYLLFKLRIGKVNILGTDMLVSKNAAKNVTFGV